MTEIQLLHQRWIKADGYQMPVCIASLPVNLIRRAIKWRERGWIVAVPRDYVPVEEQSDDSSLRDWDDHNNN